MNDKVVVVNKLGSDHFDASKNNQDYFFKSDKLKMVFDGCSDCENSEVGVKLFASLFSEMKKEKGEDPEAFESNVQHVFERMLSLSNNINFIFNNYCFTIVAVFETDIEFIVKYAGDGFVITRKDDEIDYIELKDGCNGDCPKYYIYNYIDPEYLDDYKDGIKINTMHFSKEEYQNVGVATDGLRFVTKLEYQEQRKLKENLIDGKSGKIKMLINRNRIRFHDDITICF